LQDWEHGGQRENWTRLMTVVVVVVVVVAVSAAAAVPQIAAVVAIATVTNPCQACTGCCGARRLKVPDFLTISRCRWQGCQPHALAAFITHVIFQVLISVKRLSKPQGP